MIVAPSGAVLLIALGLPIALSIGLPAISAILAGSHRQVDTAGYRRS